MGIQFCSVASACQEEMHAIASAGAARACGGRYSEMRRKERRGGGGGGWGVLCCCCFLLLFFDSICFLFWHALQFQWQFLHGLKPSASAILRETFRARAASMRPQHGIAWKRIPLVGIHTGSAGSGCASTCTGGASPGTSAGPSTGAGITSIGTNTGTGTGTGTSTGTSRGSSVEGPGVSPMKLHRELQPAPLPLVRSCTPQGTYTR